MTRTEPRRVRPDELRWEKLGTHGLRRRLLRHDPRTGYTTSMVDIPRGWRGGGIAHYHHAFEEVYIWSGSVTVGGRHYWRRGDYFYRPALVVHGHDERSDEGALAIIRSDGPLELLLVHEPAEDDEYPLQPITDSRGHVKHITIADLAWRTGEGFPAGWRIKPLSADARSGARTLAVEVPAGWRRGADRLPGRDTAWEAMVIDGQIHGRSLDFRAADYASGPAGMEAFDADGSPAGCTFILWQLPRDP